VTKKRRAELAVHAKQLASNFGEVIECPPAIQTPEGPLPIDFYLPQIGLLMCCPYEHKVKPFNALVHVMKSIRAYMNLTFGKPFARGYYGIEMVIDMGTEVDFVQGIDATMAYLDMTLKAGEGATWNDWNQVGDWFEKNTPQFQTPDSVAGLVCCRRCGGMYFCASGGFRACRYGCKDERGYPVVAAREDLSLCLAENYFSRLM
jgi:hypothetical protein